MKNASKSFKYFLIAVLVVIVAGFTVFGIFGFNQDVNYGNGYELNITLEQNVGESASAMKEAADKYLADCGISNKVVAFQKSGEGKTLIYKFSADVSEDIDVSALTSQIDTTVTDKTGFSLNSKANFYQVIPNHFTQNLLVLLGAGIILVVLFVYLVFLDKLAGAVSALVSMVVSTLVFVALVGATRIYAGEFIGVGMMITVALSGAFTTAIVAKCKEDDRNVGNNKLTYFQIADGATQKVSVYAGALTGALVVTGIALAVLVSVSVGVQLIIAGVSTLVTITGFSGFMWAAIKNTKKDRKGDKNAAETELETDIQDV